MSGLGNDDESEKVKKIATIILRDGQSSKKLNLIRGGKKNVLTEARKGQRKGVSNGLCEHLRACEQCVYFCEREQ